MARREQHADRVQAVIATDAPARSALAASWRRSSALHGLDPAAARPPRRLSDSRARCGARAHGPAARRGAGEPRPALSGGRRQRLLRAAGRPRRRAGRPARRAPATTATFEGWGLWTGRGLERGQRGHQRHRHLPDRAAPADDPPRPAFLREEHRAELHRGAALGPRGAARRGARRLVVPGRPHRGHAAADRCWRSATPRGGSRRRTSAWRSRGRASCWRRRPRAGCCSRSMGTTWCSAPTRAARQALGIDAARLQPPLPAADLLRDARREDFGERRAGGAGAGAGTRRGQRDRGGGGARDQPRDAAPEAET